MAAPEITVTFNPPLASDSGAVFDAKAFDTIGKINPWGLEANAVAAYCGEQSNSALASAVAAAAGSLDLADREGFAGQVVGVEDGPGYPLAGFDIEEIQPATQAQAEDGTGTGVYMDPLRVAQAIDVRCPVIISVTSLTNVANFDIALPVGYDDYALRVESMIPATDGTDLGFRTSPNGTSFDSGGTDYTYNRTDTSSTISNVIAISTGGVTVGGGAGEPGFFGSLNIFNANNSSLFTTISATGGYVRNNGDAVETHVVGIRNAASSVRAVRFYFSSGNVSSGRVILTGIKA